MNDERQVGKRLINYERQVGKGLINYETGW